MQRAVVRILVILTLSLGVNYVLWRWTASVNWSVWWIAVPLVVAETYGLVDAFLFGVTMWRIKERGEPPPPDPQATVDVFVTTGNEPVDLVMTTARAAAGIRYPHQTWVLDDGARPEMRAAAHAEGIGYITRSEDRANMPRHAKAGNLDNALFATEGEFLLILDADQIPEPTILDRVLGYFRDPQVAVVQTPQFFVDVGNSDPLGSQAPLFHGPIQKGKDGWNAAFFCGSNAVLRREALMQLGISGYVKQVERTVTTVLETADSVLAKARSEAKGQSPGMLAAIDQVAAAVRDARRDVGKPGRASIAEITYRFRQRVDEASKGLVDADVAELEQPYGRHAAHVGPVLDDTALTRLAQKHMSPRHALASVRALVDAVDVSRSDEAQPILPTATLPVTEDVATAMRLHSLGWKSVYHRENLAHGVAPEDLGTMLQQRLRWATGTCFDVRPVTSYGPDFLIRLVPYLVVNQLLFLVIGYGKRTWRGTQYSLALFPLWIRATWTAFANVAFHRRLGFVVTPESKQEQTGPPWRLIWPQLTAMVLLVAAGGVGTARYLMGTASTSWAPRRSTCCRSASTSSGSSSTSSSSPSSSRRRITPARNRDSGERVSPHEHRHQDHRRRHRGDPARRAADDGVHGAFGVADPELDALAGT